MLATYRGMANADTGATSRQHGDLMRAYLEEVNAKTCPTCNTVAESHSDCNSVRCYTCHRLFCWLCGMDLGTRSTDAHAHYFRSQRGLTATLSEKAMMRPRCAGLMGGGARYEARYEERNGVKIFGMANPLVARGI